ncbi:MAG: hypothetical protein Pg6C_10590 [Treponemataceae bacterium]|nr:MAG: hypothetical protein Pg6C_10590 [Treponemataceae bacterium]
MSNQKIDYPQFSVHNRRLFALYFLFFVFCPLLSAQSRDIPIYVPEPTGGTAEQRQYFLDNFKMELEGAKYPVVDSLGESQYSLPLSISDNPYFGEEGEEKFILTIVLIRTKGNSEVVRFEFPFTDLQEMYEWNLFLVYRTMGNAVAYYDYEAEEMPAAPKSGPGDRWRNQWLYATGALGVILGYYVPPGTSRLGMGFIMPVGSLGAECQFLNFMSAEVDAKMRLLNNGKDFAYSPTLAVLLKGIWKPRTSFMIEPYAGAEGSLGDAPKLSGLCGVQFGFEGGARSAFTLDIGVTVSFLGTVRVADGHDYSLAYVCVAGGYKFGWFDRKKK